MVELGSFYDIHAIKRKRFEKKYRQGKFRKIIFIGAIERV